MTNDDLAQRLVAMELRRFPEQSCQPRIHRLQLSAAQLAVELHIDERHGPRRSPHTLCDAKLSVTTMLPGLSVGTSCDRSAKSGHRQFAGDRRKDAKRLAPLKAGGPGSRRASGLCVTLPSTQLGFVAIKLRRRRRPTAATPSPANPATSSLRQSSSGPTGESSGNEHSRQFVTRTDRRLPTDRCRIQFAGWRSRDF